MSFLKVITAAPVKYVPQGAMPIQLAVYLQCKFGCLMLSMFLYLASSARC